MTTGGFGELKVYTVFSENPCPHHVGVCMSACADQRYPVSRAKNELHFSNRNNFDEDGAALFELNALTTAAVVVPRAVAVHAGAVRRHRRGPMKGRDLAHDFLRAT